jgi:hypothetical protein
MENKNNLLLRVLLIAVVVLISWGLTENYNQRSAPIATGTHVCKEDSLNNVINQMQIDMVTQENSWDSRETRYEQIIFEFNYGIDHLKNYQPEAYKEFHRIISHKESYSHEDERENKKRLNIKDEYNR